MLIAAIDPGTTQSALVTSIDQTYRGEILPNDEIIRTLRSVKYGLVLIEKVESFGMAVGKEVFETVYWSGRFHESAGCPVERISRKQVKLAMCQSMRAKDPNIRQALLDRFGGKDTAIGKKASPGKLYGFSSHMWSALAVLETWRELERAAA